MTAEEKLLEDVTLLVSKEQTWIEAVVLEKLGFNWKTVSLAAGVHDLYFDQPYAAGRTAYQLLTNVMTPQNGPDEDIGCLIKEKHEAYFKVWVSADCIFSYASFNPTVAI